MAIRNLEVVITVTDKASKDLDNVSNKVRKTGKAAKDASLDFTAFNRTLFATTAFVGTFLKVFQGLNRSFEEGANLDRLSNQFERLFGPKNHFSTLLTSFTDTFVDEMEGMRQAVSLKSLGIVGSVEQVAEVFARASVASKKAGKDSAEGIKNYAEFLKDGNVSHLQFLNLIAQTNPALQAQMAIIGKVGGVMSNVISTQSRLALGQRLLYLATKDSMKGGRDLTDTLRFMNQQWTLFRGEVGRLLLTALQPLMEHVALFINKMRMMVDNVRANEKHLVFLTKVVVVATSAVLGLAGALGTLRLASMALNSLGFGLPRLLFFTVALSTAFLGITNRAEKLTDKLRVFGAFIKGIWQLVTTLNRKTGIAQIDEDVKKLLEENGLMTFVQNIARGISVVQSVIKDVMNVFRMFSSATDRLFGNIGRNFINVISKFKEPWENFWVSDSATPMQKFVRSFAVFGGTLGTIFTSLIVKTLAGKAMGLMSKIPVIGGLFGSGGGRQPKGTSRDPMYVRMADGMSTGLMGMMGLGNGGALKGIFDLFKQTLGATGFISALKELPVLFGLLGNATGGVLGVFRTISGVIGNVVAPIMVFGSALYGAIQGIWETFGEWKKFFTGVFDLGKALGSVVLNFINSIPFLKYIKDTLVNVASGIYKVGKFLLVDGPMSLMKMIAQGWKQIFGWLGIGAGKLGESMTALAKNISPESFSGLAANPLENSKVADTGAASSAGGSGDKTNITIPEDKVSSEGTVDALGEQLKGLSDSQRKQAQQAIEDAMRSDSAGGSAITAEEMENIMRNTRSEEVGILGRIEQNTRSTNKGVTGSRRE